MNPGIYYGLVAALMMAAAYLSSGWALRRTPGLTPAGMLCNAIQAMIGIFLVGIWLVWDRGLVTQLGGYIAPILGTAMAYSLGQGLVFLAQRDIDASRIVPLLGLKLPALALLNLLAFGHHFKWWQLVAISLTVLAAFILDNAGSRIGLSRLAIVMAGCLCYCVSDTCISMAVARLQRLVYDGDLVRASAANTLITYMVCGVAGAVAIRLGPPAFRVRGAALHAIPYAIFWVPSVILLGICFGYLGTVGGNIIQASRGLLAIVLVQLLSSIGLYRVDGRATRAVVLRRCLAALMLIAAAAIYNA